MLIKTIGYSSLQSKAITVAAKIRIHAKITIVIILLI